MTTSTAADGLRSAINHALAAGVTRGEIFSMVAAAPPPSATPETWPHRPGEVEYDEAPAGMTTPADAALKYGVRHNTLSVAVYRGMLHVAGRITRRHGGGKTGGRALTVVAEAALRHYHELPDGLITVSDADRRYDVPTRRLHWWANGGKLTRVGYLRDRSRRGRSALLLAEAEVAAIDDRPGRISTPPKRGNVAQPTV